MPRSRCIINVMCRHFALCSLFNDVLLLPSSSVLFYAAIPALLRVPRCLFRSLFKCRTVGVWALISVSSVLLGLIRSCELQLPFS